jgi:hypothetical protein
MRPLVKTAVVIDYQNVNTRASKLFSKDDEGLAAKTFVNPWRFAKEALAFRNRFRPSAEKLNLNRVSVFRGLPHPVLDAEENALNQIQKEKWEHDGNGKLEVIHRDLSYRTGPDKSEEGSRNFKKYLAREEKGIDVLCAIALLRFLQDEDIDAVILASIDSDLEPALEEGIRISLAKPLETLSWHLPDAPGGKNRIGAKLGIWNTGLPESVYRRVLD